jgi:dipeptidyl aminopeptidase/acylaminoacyl peptidase
MLEKYLTIEEFIALPKLSNPAISDDGTKVAYVKRQVDWDSNAYQWHVWIYEDGKHYSLTRGKNESYAPKWAPSASLNSTNTLAYLAKPNERDRKRQIFIKPNGDVTGIQISYASEDISAFQWAPSGDGFFFIAKEVEAKPIKKRREIYGEIEYVNRDYRYNTLYYLDLRKGLEKTTAAGKLPKDLRAENGSDELNGKKTEEKDELSVQFTALKNLHVSEFEVAPNGNKVAILATPSPNLAEQDQTEVYILDVESKQIQKLDVPFVGVKRNILFSPDSKYICFTYLRTGKWFDDKFIAVYHLDSNKITQLSATGIDECIYPLRWTNKGILIWWQEKTSSKIGYLSLTGEVTPLVADANSYIQIAAASLDGKHFTYLKGDSKQCYELYHNHSRITLQSNILENNAFAQKEVIRWSSLDGTEIEGILCKPVDFDPNKKYPLLVRIHGGPKSTSLAIALDENTYPLESFVEKGFLVMQPNYRGSNGYGEKFRSLNYQDLGIGDYADVIAGVDYLIAQGFVDNDKVGVMGWSQGGYISAFCATYSNRFKATSVGAGISNWVTYYVSTDIHPFTHYYLGDTPWNNMEVYQKASPMTYIKSSSTPTLIQHGDADKRVPVSNAYELYRGLCDVGVKTELVIFKNMGHGVNKPGIARALMKQNLIWFCHHLLGESMDEFYLGAG